MGRKALTADQCAEKTNCVADSPLWRTGGVVTPRCKLLLMEGESTGKKGLNVGTIMPLGAALRAVHLRQCRLSRADCTDEQRHCGFNASSFIYLFFKCNLFINL